MACFHPLLGLPTGINPATGKKFMKIIPYSDAALKDPVHGKDLITIPCGNCIGCRLDYSRQWANRCMMELEYHEHAHFVTLTYDNDHVPISYYADPDTGEAHKSLTLQKRDLQLFLKRLRKANPDSKIRYFACGEYGGQTQRPHYHLIIYGLPLNDLVLYKRSCLEGKSDISYNYYNSASLQRAWSVLSSSGEYLPIGHAVIGKVTWDTCAYTARYILKKHKGLESGTYAALGLEPPFTVMSRKPGIARQYYDDHPDMYDHEYINLTTSTGGRKIRPPKYFDRLFDLDDPEASAARREKSRVHADAQRELKCSQSNLSYSEMLSVQERSLKSRSKTLKRTL